MRNIRLTTVAIIIIASTTSSVFASWWNPTTWKIFRRDNKISVEQKIDNTATSSQVLQNANENNTLSCNGSKYSQCPSGQIFICPTTGEAFCEKNTKDEIMTPKVKDSYIVATTSKPKELVSKNIKTAPLVNVEKSTQKSSQATPEYSQNAINLIAAQIEANNSALDKIKLNKKFYQETRSMWSDELTKTEIYLNSSPEDSGLVRDAKVYKLTIEIIDTKTNSLNSIEDFYQKVNNILQDTILKFKTTKVSGDDMGQLIALLTKMQADSKVKSDTIDTMFTDFYNFSHETAIKIEALHNVESSNKKKQAIEIEQKMAEIERLKRGINDSVQKAQDALNSYKSINCTSRYTGIQGNYQITCN